MALTKPTPPVPPTIDKGEATEYTPKFDAHKFFEIPFKRDNEPVAQDEKPVEIPIPTPPPQPVEKTPPTPEEMAREAVANGAGALTKRTITRPDEETNSEPSIDPRTLQSLQNTDSERGKAVLREFQAEDRQMYQSNAETPRNFNFRQQEGHGGIFWIVTLVLAGVLSIVFVRKFLVKEKPALKKSDLFNDADKRLQAVNEKVSTPIKKSPPKNDDDKGKHFEVRV